MGARYYDPTSGTFISVDPVLDTTLTAQFNAYVYSGNNPVTWSDPSGLAWRMDNDHPDGGYDLNSAARITVKTPVKTFTQWLGDPAGPGKNPPADSTNKSVEYYPDPNRHYPKPWQQAQDWLFQQAPDEVVFTGGGYIDWIKSDERFKKQRVSVLSAGQLGVFEIAIHADETAPALVQQLNDAFVYATWPAAEGFGRGAGGMGLSGTNRQLPGHHDSFSSHRAATPGRIRSIQRSVV